MKSHYDETETDSAKYRMIGNQLSISIECDGDMTNASRYIRNSQMKQDNNIIFWKEMEEDEAAFRKRTGR